MNFYDRIIEWFAKSRLGGWLFVNVFTHIDRRIMKWTNGRFSTGFGSRFQQNALLLTCIGAKSGQERDIPLVFAWSGDDIILIASRAGHDKNPAWYYNLRANPDCTVRVNGQVIDCTATQVTGDERTRRWQEAVSVYSGYENYAERTDREIPVFVLSPRA